MARKQYNSAADRRWQQRYQRIQDRKDSMPDYETPRDERRRRERKQRRVQYVSKPINVDMIIPDKTAFICESASQIRQVYNAMRSKRPEYVPFLTSDELEMSFYFGTGAPMAIGIVTREMWYGGRETSLSVELVSYFERLGFEIMEFYRLLPVKDLGKVKESPESVEFLLGI